MMLLRGVRMHRGLRRRCAPQLCSQLQQCSERSAAVRLIPGMRLVITACVQMMQSNEGTAD